MGVIDKVFYRTKGESFNTFIYNGLSEYISYQRFIESIKYFAKDTQKKEVKKYFPSILKALISFLATPIAMKFGIKFPTLGEFIPIEVGTKHKPMVGNTFSDRHFAVLWIPAESLQNEFRMLVREISPDELLEHGYYEKSIDDFDTGNSIKGVHFHRKRTDPIDIASVEEKKRLAYNKYMREYKKSRKSV